MLKMAMKLWVPFPNCVDDTLDVRDSHARNDQPLYEYVCHEGNYGLYNILAGAREAEKAEEEATSR